jgi:sialic acid synthase SpsE
MIAVLRPGIGIKPKYMDLVVGRKARRDIEPNEPITWEDI